MPFHAYAKPSNYVGLFPTTRTYLYADADLVGGNVVVYSQYRGLIREKGSTRPDSPNTYATRQNYGYPVPDAGPAPIAGDPWGTIGGFIYLSDPALNNSILNVADNGEDHNDMTVDVKVGAGWAGLQSHAQATNNFIFILLDMDAQRLAVRRWDGPLGPVLMATGTTVLTPNTFYTLRAVEASNNVVSVYLNGVLELTFDLTGVNYFGGAPVSSYRGTGMAATGAASATARFKNFYVAPQGPMTATQMTVRNYDGDIVYQTSIAGLPDPTQLTIPDSALKQRNNLGPYGWYRVYLTGPDRGDGQFGTAYGDCSFVRIPASNLPGNSLYPSEARPPGDTGDTRARSVLGMGSTRFAIGDASIAAATTIAEMLPQVSLAKQLHTDTASPARPRNVLMAFPNGTKGNEANVTAIVNGLKPYVKAWECRNEPNFTPPYVDPGSGAPLWVSEEFGPFYNAVKAADPTAIVMGPGSVSFNDSGVNYFGYFLNPGNGANYCDAFSFHPYNCYNGDLALTRHTLGKVHQFITYYGVAERDWWMTEQGFGWNYAGLVYPRYATRWTMLMYFGQEVVTHGRMRPETTTYWYDFTIGFDTFPMYWLTTAGPGPTTVPVRTMEAELWNKTFISEFDFGDQVVLSGPLEWKRIGSYAQNLYLGGVWSGSDGTKTVGLMAGSAGATDPVLDVTGASNLTCVDPWGNTFTLTVTAGRATFPISELPQWIRCPVGVTVAPVPLGLTQNVALTATATTDASCKPGTYDGVHQYSFGSEIFPERVNNGVQENQHGSYFGAGMMVYAPNLPFSITLTWPSAIQANRVVMHCYPPWQSNGIPIAIHIDTWDGSQWTTRYTKTRPASKSFPFVSLVARCTYETYWDEQWIFDAQFSTVTTTKIRVVIDDCSYASGETGPGGAYDALWGGFGGGLEGGPPGTVQTCRIREIEVFGVGAPHTVSARGIGAATGSAVATRTTGVTDAQHAANLQAMRAYVRPDEQAAIDRAVALLAP